MLCIGMRAGEYVKIGEDVVVQCEETSGTVSRMLFSAPREIPIVRGKVLEATGESRPDCVVNGPKTYRHQLDWNMSKAQSLAKIRRTLDGMEDSPEKTILLRNLNNIFPEKE